MDGHRLIVIDPAGMAPLKSQLELLGIPCETPEDEAVGRDPSAQRAEGLLTWVQNPWYSAAFAEAVFAPQELQDPAAAQAIGRIFSKVRTLGTHPVAAAEETSASFSPDESIHRDLMGAVSAFRELDRMLDQPGGALSDVVAKAIELCGGDPGDATDSGRDVLLREAETLTPDGLNSKRQLLTSLLDRLNPDLCGAARRPRRGLTITGSPAGGYWRVVFVVNTRRSTDDTVDLTALIYAALTRAIDRTYYLSTAPTPA